MLLSFFSMKSYPAAAIFFFFCSILTILTNAACGFNIIMSMLMFIIGVSPSKRVKVAVFSGASPVSVVFSGAYDLLVTNLKLLCSWF